MSDPRFVLVLTMDSGRVYRVLVPAGFTIEEATSRRGLLAAPMGSFAMSQVVSAELERATASA
jgi:hypothetical protein